MRWYCETTWQITLYLHLQKTHGHQTRQGGDLSWEASTIKAFWPSYHVTNVRSNGSLKNLYLDFHKSFGHKVWQFADLVERFS